MEQRYFARVVVRCTLCKTCVAPMYCEHCHSNLCEDCGKKHSSKIHNIVPLEQYLTTPNYPKCKQHSGKQCENYCEQCDVPICVQCVSSKEHVGHKQIDFLKKFESKKEILERDLKELEGIIYPRYQHIVSDIRSQKADLCINSQRLITNLDNRREAWHKEIDTIISNLKSEISETNSKHMAFLDKHEDKTTPILFQIKQIIANIKKIRDSKNVSLFSEYKSRNAEFINLPPKVNVSLPRFTYPEINKDRLVEQFGSLSALSFTTEEQDYSMPTQGAESSPPDRSLIGVPRVITEIDTKSGGIYSMACLNDTEIWTRGFGNIMHLYNINGELIKEIQTKSGKQPKDIALTMCGNLVYTDVDDKSVNIVRNAQIQTVIKLHGWIPCCVCCTSSDDLLVTMEIDDADEENYDYDDEDDDTITKVVRYTGSIEKQSIQFNEKGRPLYSSGGSIVQNRNLDICVADNVAGAVVVVNQGGKLRFSYKGLPSTAEKLFYPSGIATDSQSRILTADPWNHNIHILDKDGQLICYINNCGLEDPSSLCVDTRDHVFVAEIYTSKVKKIRYYN